MEEKVRVVPESALRFEINFRSDIEVLEALVILYCQRRVLLKDLSRVPRPKLINMLCMYIRYGYSSGTKKKLKEIFNEVDMTNINSWNRELRRDRFLVKDTMNENISFLSKDLKDIKEYYEKAKGKIDIKVMFTLKE